MSQRTEIRRAVLAALVSSLGALDHPADVFPGDPMEDTNLQGSAWIETVESDWESIGLGPAPFNQRETVVVTVGMTAYEEGNTDACEVAVDRVDEMFGALSAWVHAHQSLDLQHVIDALVGKSKEQSDAAEKGWVHTLSVPVTVRCQPQS